MTVHGNFDPHCYVQQFNLDFQLSPLAQDADRSVNFHGTKYAPKGFIQFIQYNLVNIIQDEIELYYA